MPRGQLRSVLGHIRRLLSPPADPGVTDRDHPHPQVQRKMEVLWLKT
jgi:hypothetical protein